MQKRKEAIAHLDRKNTISYKMQEKEAQLKFQTIQSLDVGIIVNSFLNPYQNQQDAALHTKSL